MVDPRRTETARAVRARAGATRRRRLAAAVAAARHLRRGPRGRRGDRARSRPGSSCCAARAAAHSTGGRPAAITGVPAADVRQLARDFATAPSAAAYGRTGSCLGRHAHPGRLPDRRAHAGHRQPRPAGGLWSSRRDPPGRGARPNGSGSRPTTGAASRLGDFPDVLGSFPAALMAEEITTPGDGPAARADRVARATRCCRCRTAPALVEALLAAGPDGVARPLRQRHQPLRRLRPARDDLARARGLPDRRSHRPSSPTPFIQATEPRCSTAYGEARQEWEVFDEICPRAGIGMFLLGPLRARLADGVTRRPAGAARRRGCADRDRCSAIGPYGDRFGLRRGGINANEGPRATRTASCSPSDAATGSQACGPPPRRPGPPRPAGDRRRSWLGCGPAPGRPGVPAAPDRAARAPVAQLLDAQRSDPDEGHAHVTPRGSTPSDAAVRRDRRRRARAHPLPARRHRDAGAGHRRGRPGHRRGAARLGPRRAARGSSPTRPVARTSTLLASTDPADLELLAGMAHLNGIPVVLEAV